MTKKGKKEKRKRVEILKGLSVLLLFRLPFLCFQKKKFHIRHFLNESIDLKKKIMSEWYRFKGTYQ